MCTPCFSILKKNVFTVDLGSLTVMFQVIFLVWKTCSHKHLFLCLYLQITATKEVQFWRSKAVAFVVAWAKIKYIPLWWLLDHLPFIFLNAEKTVCWSLNVWFCCAAAVSGGELESSVTVSSGRRFSDVQTFRLSLCGHHTQTDRNKPTPRCPQQDLSW